MPSLATYDVVIVGAGASIGGWGVVLKHMGIG